MLNSLRKMLVKPRFGMRRCSGIWPPSKPRIMREPVRERCPLCPRVDVLPMPEPMPRPTRLRFSVAFFGARMFDKFISKLSAFSSQPSAFSPKRFTPRADSRKLMALFHHFDHMRHLGHHAADSLVVRTLDDLIQPGESQPLDHQLLFHRGPVKQKLVIKGLGFTRLNQVIERPDNQAIRGMVAKVPHMVEVVE